MPTKKAVSEAARLLSAKRKTFSGGDTTKLAPCRYCGEPMGARARRAHQPHCSKHPKRTA